MINLYYYQSNTVFFQFFDTKEYRFVDTYKICWTKYTAQYQKNN